MVTVCELEKGPIEIGDLPAGEKNMLAYQMVVVQKCVYNSFKIRLWDLVAIVYQPLTLNNSCMKALQT